VLYPSSQSIIDASKAALGDSVFAINTTPNYARQEVMAVDLTGSGSALHSSSAQISSDGKKGYVLVDATKTGSVGVPKGVYASMAPVTGQLGHNLY
jgi:alpha-mannosidase